MESNLTSTTFKQLNLDNWLIKNLEGVGINKPTKI